MSGKVVLITIGSILLILGITLLVAASQHDWEVSRFKDVFGKDPPADIQKVTNIIGGILTAGGLGLLGWGISMHVGVTKHLAK